MVQNPIRVCVCVHVGVGGACVWKTEATGWKERKGVAVPHLIQAAHEMDQFYF